MFVWLSDWINEWPFIHFAWAVRQHAKYNYCKSRSLGRCIKFDTKLNLHKSLYSCGMLSSTFNVTSCIVKLIVITRHMKIVIFLETDNYCDNVYAARWALIWAVSFETLRNFSVSLDLWFFYVFTFDCVTHMTTLWCNNLFNSI